MTVQQLKYILKVAEVGSITEAAKQLFISQPSLSNSIKETEKEAGITIFLRSRIGITPVSYTHLDVYKRQALNNVSVIVFDKTGTLTKGVFNVTDILPANISITTSRPRRRARWRIF